MNERTVRDLLLAVRDGRLTIDDAYTRLRSLPFEDLGFAKVDHHRAIRCGFPEVIYCEGKTPPQIRAIFGRCAAQGGNVIATRASREAFAAIAAEHSAAAYHESARAITLRQRPPQTSEGTIAIVMALHDVGVAGLHRLLAHSAALQAANVIIVVAGMEGALASVVGGLVDSPVIAVPTSVGYGASFGGIAALLTMLNSCASGVTVVNIDNGFGAGYTAALINRRRKQETR